ncbi:hypothetical protein [Psychrobacter pocilloporae]|uniref:Outer membrane protein G1b n=1 Tax=Psychrobacter pocilloporae TaxID=1775882 RepID=A0ABT6ITX6_9GAMM|nr:hypothetical protein [Psychrobacter pocilloporae]MDH4904976.1 hypothetical protein [Psychrobacter pocilloporae]
MKLIKLTAISAAVLASTAALAADPVIVVDNNDAVVYEAKPVAVAYQAEPAYVYNSDAGIVRNTTGAVFGGTKTFFQTAVNPASVSAEVGTLGYGANIGWSLNEKTELQAGWAGGDVSDIKDDFDVDDINYDIDDADFSNPYLGVQMRPAANWFTVGAGIIVPDNDFEVTASAEGPNFRIDNIDYNAEDVGTLSGTLEHRNDLAPYLTVGFRPNISDRWGVFGEIGAAYMGKTDATVRSSNPTQIVRVTGGDELPVTGAEVARRAESELEDKDWLEWLPIVKLGATYRF